MTLSQIKRKFGYAEILKKAYDETLDKFEKAEVLNEVQIVLERLRGSYEKIENEEFRPESTQIRLITLKRLAKAIDSFSELREKLEKELDEA